MSADPSTTPTRRGTRWLLFGSLALNLFFIGIAIAMFVNAPPRSTWDRNVFVRLERLAVALPSSDATVLRAEVAAKHAVIETAQAAYRAAQDDIRATLRKEPFSVEEMNAATAKTRAARQNYDQILQEVVAAAASKMSPAGRQAMADWPPSRRASGKR